MRIGVVNEQAGGAEFLERVLRLRTMHAVAWTAASGAEGVERCRKDTPDLVLMDLLMTGMDGVEATRRIMASTPCAILIVTGSVDANPALVFAAMGAGALDAVDVPVFETDATWSATAPLLTKIATIAQLIEEPRASGRVLQPRSIARRCRSQALIAIGASAGGPAALAAILGGLPEDFPAAVVIVQHVDARFVSGMAEWLARQSRLPVRVAKDGDRLSPGNVLLAGTSDHLALMAADRVGYRLEPRHSIYRPSIDVLFQSVTRHWPGDAVGVLLTGMGRDGALGLKALRTCGHYTVAQDEASSAVYGMPRAAVALDAAVDVLPLEDIARKLADQLSARTLSVRT